jgi:hypothetical protein
MQDLLEEIRETGYHDLSDDETVRKNTRLPKAKNGKERGVKPAVRRPAGEAQNEQLFDANANANVEDGSVKHKSGPLPLDIQDRAIAAHEDFLNAIERLANEAGKSAHTLHQFLGTSVKLLRDSSPWNVWQSYYAEKNPKSPNSMSSPLYTCLRC